MIEGERTFRLLYLAAVFGVLLIWSQRAAEAVTFPGPPPGEATARIDATTIVLENHIFYVACEIAAGRLKT